MLRKTLWVAVVLFVAADIVLVVLAVRHTRPDGGSSAQVTVTITTRLPPTSGDVPPVTGASGQAGSGSSGTTSDVAPTKVGDTSGTSGVTADGSAGALSAGAQTEGRSVRALPASRRLMLDMSSDGHVIRASRGDCTSDTPATVAISGNGGRSWTAVDSAASAVLQVGALRGDLWYVGTGYGCQPVEMDSKDGGATWQSVSAAGAWFLDADARSRSIHGPAGASDAGCVPVALAGIDGDEAVAACADGEIRTTADSGSSWRTASRLSGVVAISFLDARHGYALAATPDCAATVLKATEPAGWQRLKCLPGDRPLAIAAAGDRILAQIGSALMGSEDGGVTWKLVS